MTLRTATNGKTWMSFKAIGLLLTAVLLGFASNPAFAQQSITTRHNYEKCPEAPSPEPDVIEVRRCSGPTGIAVLWMSEPDSSSVSFGNNPLDEDLGIGAAFEVGTVIEWRSGKTGKTPIAAVIRYRTGDSVGKINKSRLVVHRIEPSGRSCIMGIITGNAANDKARVLIDGSADHFICGKSGRTDKQ